MSADRGGAGVFSTEVLQQADAALTALAALPATGVSRCQDPITVRCVAGHLRRYQDLAALIRDLDLAVSRSTYTSLVGTGVSGALVVPRLGEALRLPWALVRKADEKTHSRNLYLEGELTDRWLFVDDLIDTGSTLYHVLDSVESAARFSNEVPTYVGAYLYDTAEFRPAPTKRRDRETLEYTRRARSAILGRNRTIQPWVTDRCPDCHKAWVWGSEHTYVIGPSLTSVVIIGCKKTRVINPAVLNLSFTDETWVDWRPEEERADSDESDA